MSNNIDRYFLNNYRPSLQGFLDARYSSSVDLPALMDHYIKPLQNIRKCKDFDDSFENNIISMARTVAVKPESAPHTTRAQRAIIVEWLQLTDYSN
jgi:hypothetical protein